MKAEDAQQLWTVFWNYEKGTFWIATIAEATMCGMSRFNGQDILKKLDQLKEEDRTKIMEAHHWIFLGIFDSDREASDFAFKIGTSKPK